MKLFTALGTFLIFLTGLVMVGSGTMVLFNHGWVTTGGVWFLGALAMLLLLTPWIVVLTWRQQQFLHEALRMQKAALRRQATAPHERCLGCGAMDEEMDEVDGRCPTSQEGVHHTVRVNNRGEPLDPGTGVR